MNRRYTRFKKKILFWYRAHGRHDLQWRKTRDPYKIFISELMLQQTQVDRVIPQYANFVKKISYHTPLRLFSASGNTYCVERAWVQSSCSLYKAHGRNNHPRLQREISERLQSSASASWYWRLYRARYSNIRVEYAKCLY